MDSFHIWKRGVPLDAVVPWGRTTPLFFRNNRCSQPTLYLRSKFSNQPSMDRKYRGRRKHSALTMSRRSDRYSLNNSAHRWQHISPEFSLRSDRRYLRTVEVVCKYYVTLYRWHTASWVCIEYPGMSALFISRDEYTHFFINHSSGPWITQVSHLRTTNFYKTLLLVNSLFKSWHKWALPSSLPQHTQNRSGETKGKKIVQRRRYESRYELSSMERPIPQSTPDSEPTFFLPPDVGQGRGLWHHHAGLRGSADSVMWK